MKVEFANEPNYELVKAAVRRLIEDVRAEAAAREQAAKAQ